MAQDNPVPASAGVESTLIDSPVVSKEQLRAAFQTTTSTLLQVAGDFGNPDGFWAARGAPLFAELAEDIRQLTKHKEVSTHLCLLPTVESVHVLTFAIHPAVQNYNHVDMRTTQ